MDGPDWLLQSGNFYTFYFLLHANGSIQRKANIKSSSSKFMLNAMLPKII